MVKSISPGKVVRNHLEGIFGIANRTLEKDLPHFLGKNRKINK
jgi:hypothetical protein